jgi:hypothetical protein
MAIVAAARRGAIGLEGAPLELDDVEPLDHGPEDPRRVVVEAVPLGSSDRAVPRDPPSTMPTGRHVERSSHAFRTTPIASSCGGCLSNISRASGPSARGSGSTGASALKVRRGFALPLQPGRYPSPNASASTSLGRPNAWRRTRSKISRTAPGSSSYSASRNCATAERSSSPNAPARRRALRRARARCGSSRPCPRSQAPRRSGARASFANR